MAETFFITTAIDYTNGAPHIGHAYEKVLADVLARYHRLKGDDVFFLTGVDQHGQKVQQSAEKQGIPPQEFVDGITAKFKALWKKLDVRYDDWAATTDPKHKDCVRAILQRLWDDKGTDGQSKWIYKKSEGGYYSVRQEQFLTDKERGEDGEFGPEWQPVEFREEENFYFRLMPHKQWLLDLIDSRSAAGKPLVIPDFRVGELRNAVEKLDGDLCISRPAARLQWGIPFPESFGEGFVTYVWFDALVNYLSFAPGYDPTVAAVCDRRTSSPAEAVDAHRAPLQDLRHWWPPLHVIGKDIMIPAHGVYWPIMLNALGFDGDDIPQLLVHGWWNISGAKMSKSLGNVIDPHLLVDFARDRVEKELHKQKAKDSAKGKATLSDVEIAEVSRRCGAEAVRYYLVSDIGTGKDADFSDERLVQRYNTDLANSLGNLLNRTLNMAASYRLGILRALSFGTEFEREPDGKWVQRILGSITDIGQALAAQILSLDLDKGRLVGALDHHLPSLGLESISNSVVLLNGLIQRTAPWEIAKADPSARDLDDILYTFAESLRIVAILLSPILPKGAHGIFDQLNWKMDQQGQEARFRLADATWGRLPDGHQLGKPTPLFPRIDTTPLPE